MADLNFGVNDINLIADVVRSHSQDLKEVDDFCGRVSDWTFKVSDDLRSLESGLDAVNSRIDDLSDDSGNVFWGFCKLCLIGAGAYFGYKYYKKMESRLAKLEGNNDFFEVENVSGEIQKFEAAE